MALLSMREIKLSAAVILILTLVAVIVTLVIISGRGREANQEVSGDTAAPPQTAEPEGGYNTFHLVVPDEFKGVFRPRWVPYRELHDSWASSQIEPYWIEPRQLIEEELEKDTDQSVQGFLEELP